MFCNEFNHLKEMNYQIDNKHSCVHVHNLYTIWHIA